MNNKPASNLAVTSNLWIDDDTPEKTTAWSCQAQIPGDLMVQLINDRDVRIIKAALTPKQYREYRERRFFFPHGECGISYAEI